MRRIRILFLALLLVMLPGSSFAQNAGAVTDQDEYGPGVALLAPGTNGSVEVVASGYLHSNVLPLVIRNNTDAEVAKIVVRAEVSDASGNVVATGTATTVLPAIVPVGGIALGSVVVPGDVPEHATFTYSIESASPAPREEGRYVLLDLVDATFQDGRIVGTWRNPSRTDVDNVHGIAMCLDQNGDVVAWGEAFPKGAIHERSESDFRFDLWTGNHEMCENFVIVGQAAGWGR